MTLFDAVAPHADSRLTALRFGARHWSYRALSRSIRRMAAYLTDRGIRAGDTVTVALPNIPVAVYALYALDAIGAVQNIVHPLTPREQILERMRDTGSVAAILLSTVYDADPAAFDSSPDTFFFVNPVRDSSLALRLAFSLKYRKPRRRANRFLLDDFRRTPPRPLPQVVRGEDDPAVYLYSGGTTGDPKVIVLSDRAINRLAAKIDGIIPGELAGKQMLAVLPTFHGFGLAMGIHAPLSVGAGAFLQMKFRADQVVRAIRRGQLHMMIGVPLLYQKLLAHPGFSGEKLRRLTHCFVGGDHVPLALIERFNRVMQAAGSDCRLLEGYGLTETVTVCCVNTREAYRDGSVGKPLRGMAMEVRREDGSLCGSGELGEIFISGDTLMIGYRNDPAATAATLPERDGVRWVRTGDLGYRDEDGFFFLRGRKKRVFIISGVNVYPTEVEKIATGVEDVFDASLEWFAEPKPHTVLFVIRNRAAHRSDEALRDALTAEIARHVLPYAVPRRIVFVDEFPKTRVGKIDHAAFREPEE